MTELINFFSDVPLSFRTLILLGGIVFFWVLEGMIPLYSFRYKKINHALLNLFFTRPLNKFLSILSQLSCSSTLKTI